MLHLLRNCPPRIDGRPLTPEAFLKLIARWGRTPGTLGGTWTRRRPSRADELSGGSVYFAAKGWTLFRAPFAGLERVADFTPDPDPEWRDAWAILFEPRPVMVESRRVHRLQGWRYLEPGDAPPDA